MKILIASDAWRPQVNGVVRTYETLARTVAGMDVALRFVTPDLFRSMPCPGYSEIDLAFATVARITRLVEQDPPDHIHIATEGPIGLAMRRYCLRRGLAFTTCYHTRFPEYVRLRAPIPLRLTYAAMRRFHAPSSCVMVATRSLSDDLAQRGFTNLRPWSRGVDLSLFHPGYDAPISLPKPVFAYIGRVAVEKNIEAFLDLDLPGSKVVVGDGPALERLRQRYGDVTFTGARSGPALAAFYAMADVFVFPSLTDTFGNVILEALACGTPVAAFPVMGPRDILAGTGAGVLSRDLRSAALAARAIARDRCRALALTYSWDNSARQFLHNVRASSVCARGLAGLAEDGARPA